MVALTSPGTMLAVSRLAHGPLAAALSHSRMARCCVNGARVGMNERQLRSLGRHSVSVMTSIHPWRRPFEISNEELRILNHEMCYRLVLSDGRKANIYTEIVPSNIAGKSVAEFHISEVLKKRAARPSS